MKLFSGFKRSLSERGDNLRDRELVQQAKFGDKEALAQIVKYYYNDVYLFLYRRLGDRFSAEDITQEVFLKFTQSLQQYKDKDKLKNYLLSIAVNCSNDYYRKSKREVLSDELELSEESLNVDSDIRESVKSALMQLPDEQRNVIILRYYHDMKIKEISQVVNCSQSTVKSRLYRGEKQLKEIMKGVL